MNFSASSLSQDPRLPLYQRLREEILKKIAQREWRPEEPIPTEAELAKHYGVAIGTVRKAVETLVIEGILLRQQGRGTFVRRPNFSASLSRFFHYLDERGTRYIPEGRVKGCRLCEPSVLVAGALELSGAMEAIRIDRARLMDNKVFLVEEIWLPRALFSALLELPLSAFGNLLYPFYEEHCGQTVANVRETLTIEPASGGLAAALGVSERAALVRIDRLAFNYSKQPIEWRRSYGRTEDFRYQVEVG